jgi:hypothetical protein
MSRWSATRTLHQFWGTFRVGGNPPGTRKRLFRLEAAYVEPDSRSLPQESEIRQSSELPGVFIEADPHLRPAPPASCRPPKSYQED